MSLSAPEDAFLDVNDAHLRVYGNVHADGLKLGQLEVVTTTSTGSTIQFLHQHTAFTTTSNIEVGTTNHDLFVDTQNSKVGILTNTPTKALDVNGTVKATAFDGDGALLTGIPSSAINGTLSQWTTVAGPKIHYSDGNVGIGIGDPLHTLDVVGDINFTGTLREDGNPFVSTPWTIESGPTALSYTGGNVGVGGTTPSAKLEVTGNAHVSTDLSVGGTVTATSFSGGGSALTALNAANIASGTLTVSRGGTGTTSSTGTGALVLQDAPAFTGDATFDTNTLKIDAANDRVGVGTTSPDGPLHISKSAPYNGDTGPGILFTRYSNTYGGCIWNESNNSIDGLYFNAVNNVAGAGYGATPKMVINSNGNVGIGTNTPYAKFQVNGQAGSLAASSASSFNTWANGGNYQTHNNFAISEVSIHASHDIVSGSYIASHRSNITASDERIKKDIIDAEDGPALETLRLLKPKRYKYKDVVRRGSEPVWGFIAQEVRETLPYATQLRQDSIPNIYEMVNVSESNVLTFTNFDTSTLESNAMVLKVFDKDDTEHLINIAEVIDDKSLRIEEDLSKWTQLFVYGQRVDDFVFVQKDAIWTVATAALQEVDRQLQAEKARNDTLEARIAALENNLPQ